MLARCHRQSSGALHQQHQQQQQQRRHLCTDASVGGPVSRQGALCDRRQTSFAHKSTSRHLSPSCNLRRPAAIKNCRKAVGGRGTPPFPHTHTNVTVRSHLSADVTFRYEFINFSVNYFARTHIAAATKYASSAISSCTNPGKVTGFGADVAKGRVNCSFVNLRVTIRLYQGTLNVIELHGHRLIIDSHSSPTLKIWRR